MTDVTFGKTTAPALRSGRSIEPNPFDGHFPTAVNVVDGKEVLEALTVEFDGSADANKAAITNLTGKARRAAERLNPPMTARVQTNEATDDKGNVLKGAKAKTTLVIWTVAKIKRQTADQTAEGQPATE